METFHNKKSNLARYPRLPWTIKQEFKQIIDEDMFITVEAFCEFKSIVLVAKVENEYFIKDLTGTLTPEQVKEIPALIQSFADKMKKQS